MDKAEILDFAVDFIKNQKHMQNGKLNIAAKPHLFSCL